jgi:hypothetical protein
MSDTVLDPPVDPTIEVDRLMSPEEIRLCPGCGKPETRWRENLGKGYLAEDGHTYCCTGCAHETGCTCV